MPLITCPDCEKQISDQAPACIHCGCPVPEQPQPQLEQVQLRNHPAAEIRPPEMSQPTQSAPSLRQKPNRGHGIVQGILTVIIIGILATGGAMVVVHMFERDQKKRAAAARAVLAKRASRVAGSWVKEFESKDKMTDFTNVGVRLSSDDTITRDDGKVRPDLLVRCLGGNLSVSIRPGTVVHTGLDGRTALRLRFPPKPARRFRLRVEDVTSVQLPRPAGFIHLLAKYTKLLVELTTSDFDGQRRETFSFSLYGSYPAMKLITDACGIPPPPDE